VTSFFPYTGTIQKLIKAIKYRFAYAIVEEITPMMRVPDFPSNSVLVPIPLHTLRHRWRGFNQAERIARALSKQTGTPVLKNVLVRTKNTIAQAETKSFAERQGNMKNSFQVQRTPDQTKTIFLIDDVFTTGATLQAACVALKRAGAKNVWGLTIAQ
jgi:ComF family protein